MVSEGVTPRATTTSARVGAGVIGGLVGGVAFGILMQATDMLPMVAMLIGGESVAMGWLVHLFNSALFGAIFGLLLGRWATSYAAAVGLGLVYGVVWWVLGALLIMPSWLGMSKMIFELNTMAWQSLVGHLIYGLLLGLVYASVRPRLSSGRRSR
jgi:uncharacterized membrane protein YagU involved in acid resistance